MQISASYKNRVLNALFENRKNYSGSDTAFARMLGINNTVYSRIKNGENTDQLLSAAKWISMGRILDVKLHEKKWVTAKTQVFVQLETDLKACKRNSTAMIMVDECEIGKSYSARQIVKKLQNAFYIDCSQAKSRQMFIRLLARTVGVDSTGRYTDVKKDLKYALSYMERPLIVLDEAGDLEYNAFLEVKELWNATEGACGWYMIGADGLRAKIQRGISNKKVGYREIFSRFNNNFMRVVPAGYEQKKNFYGIMIAEVLAANLPEDDHWRINELVAKVLGTENGETGELGCLRRAETVVNLIKQQNEESTHA